MSGVAVAAVAVDGIGLAVAGVGIGAWRPLVPVPGPNFVLVASLGLVGTALYCVLEPWPWLNVCLERGGG